MKYSIYLRCTAVLLISIISCKTNPSSITDNAIQSKISFIPITWDSNNNLYTIDDNGNGLRSIAEVNSVSNCLVWNAVTEEIYYHRFVGMSSVISSIKLNGENRKNILKYPGDIRDIDISNDGKYLSFTGQSYPINVNYSDIYLFNIEDSILTKLNKVTTRNKNTRFSFDDSKILYISENDGADLLYLIDLNSMGETTLNPDVNGDIIRCEWQSDHKIVFSTREAEGFFLYLYDFDENEEIATVELTQSNSRMDNFSVSPNGNQISYFKISSDYDGVFIMEISQMDEKGVLQIPYLKGDVCWVDGDQKICCLVPESTGATNLYTVNVQTLQHSRITNFDNNTYSLVYTPIY